MPPEPLVRDETLRKTGNVREWDKGKTAVHGMVVPVCCILMPQMQNANVSLIEQLSDCNCKQTCKRRLNTKR